MKTIYPFKKMLLFFLLLMPAASVFAQQGIISGKVSDITNGEVLPFANVIATINDSIKFGTTTNVDGQYNLNLEKGIYKISAVYMGYNTTIFDSIIVGDTLINLDFQLEENVQMLKSITIIEYAVPIIDACSQSSMVTVSGVCMSSSANRFRSTKKSKNKSNNFTTITSVSSNSSNLLAENNKVTAAGSLTAGQINDFGKWELWSDISKNDLKKYQDIWKIYPQNRYSVLVSSEKGLSVVDAKVILKDGDGKIIWSARTDNTGKAELWDGMLNEISGKEKTISVSYNGNEYSISNALKFPEGINLLKIPVECEIPEMVDIAVVIDATGSMDDEILYLKSELVDILNKTQNNYPDFNLNLGSVFYRCPGNSYVTKKCNFSANTLKTINFIGNQNSGEGGDEAVEQALDVAVNQLAWSTVARARILLLVLDEPPAINDSVIDKLKKVLMEAAAKGIRVIAVVGSGEDNDKDRKMEYLMRAFALGTNGTYVFLTDHSQIGNTHTKPVTDEYDVELLNDMLLRLIYEYTFVTDCDKPINDKTVEDTMYVYNPKVIAHVIVDEFLQGKYDLFDTPDTLLAVFKDSLATTTLINQGLSDTIKTDATILVTEKDIKKEKFRNFKYFPNPTSGELFIEFDGEVKEIYLADIGGKLLEKYKPEENKLMIDLSKYPTGIYFIQYFCNEKWLTGKVIKN